MKKLFAVVLFALVSATTFAAGEGDVKVTSDSSVFKVYYTKPLQTKVNIKIVNEMGDVVFTEVIKKGTKGFVRPYNLSELPKGVYTCYVEDGLETSTFQFNYVEQSKGSNMMALVNKLDNERIFMALANEKKSDVTIKIYAGQDLIYTAQESVNKQFSQLFNLKDVKMNEVTFKVFEGNKLIKEASF